MARGKGHTRRSSSRGPKNNVWTAIILNEVLLAAGANSVSSIVTSADWSNEPFGERATVLTIRGWLSVTAQADTLTKSEGQIFWYIGKVDGALPIVDIPVADSVVTYTQTNILDTGGFVASSVLGGVGGLAAQRSHSWEVNVKTMRKIRSGEDINLMVTNGTGDDIRVGGVLRALLRKGGN